MLLNPLAFAGGALLVAALLLAWLLRRAGLVARWQDTPNARSLHQRPVPRFGGLPLHAGWIGTAAVAFVSGAVALPVGWTLAASLALAGLAVVIGISVLDDRRPLAPWPRLAAQAVAATLLVAGFSLVAMEAGRMPMRALPIGLALAALWAMNLFNFMDGSDGLAGGMAFFGFGAYAVVAWPSSPWLACWAAAVAGASAGFLLFNRPPARVFMGDAGSVGLGYLAAAIGLLGIADGAWGWWLPPLAFLPFILDATFTLFRRLLRGERVWEAHREHAYQKLVRMGWGHAGTMRAAWLLMAACAGAAIALSRRGWPVQWAGLMVASVLVSILLAAVEVAWRRRGAAAA